MSGTPLTRSALLLLAVTLVALGSVPVTASARAPLPLAGKTVVLDPGHNGGNSARRDIVDTLVYAGNGIYKPCNTIGTGTTTGYREHAFTWDVANRTASILRARGAEVVHTRSSNTGVGPCVNVRARIGNQNRADAVVSIHADGNLGSGARGFHVIMPSWSGTPAAVRSRSEVLGATLRSTFRSVTGIPYANYSPVGTGWTSAATWAGSTSRRGPSSSSRPATCATARTRRSSRPPPGGRRSPRASPAASASTCAVDPSGAA